jgi:CDP-paratose 2-epimerase
MSIAIVTGSAGLIGSEASRHFAKQGLTVVGIDNDMRSEFFGEEASTLWQRKQLQKELGKHYRHVDGDIRDDVLIDNIFTEFGSDIELIVHTAAQPSHDWAARDQKKTSRSTPLERSTCWKRLGIIARTRCLFLHPPTRFMATRPTIFP